MDEEDWREIIQLVQSELRKIGHSDIADLSNYELREEGERILPNSRSLVTEILGALRRDMVARSSSTVQDSIMRLEQIVEDSEGPIESVIWLDNKHADIEAREPRERIVGIEGIPEALGELEKLIRQLSEIGFEGGLR